MELKKSYLTNVSTQTKFFCLICKFQKGGILIDGEIEDFLLLDHLFHYLIKSNAKISPSAAKIVRGALSKVAPAEFSQIITSFLNTLFLEQNRIECRVANTWTDVIIDIFEINQKLISPSFPVLEERMEKTVKPTERMKTVCLLAEFIIKGTVISL